MQYYGKITCNFCEKVLAKNILGYYVSLAFVPLRMLELLGNNEHIFSTQIMLGLPVSLEVVIVAITAVAIVKTIEKKGFVNIYSIGVAVTMLAFYLSYIAENPYTFILSRMIMGFGHGICLIVMRGYVVSNPDPLKVSEGATAFSVGVFSALNIGTVLGGIIGDNFGLEYIFVLSGLLMAISGLTAHMFISKRIIPKKSNTKFVSDIISVLKDRRLLIGILLFFVPFKVFSGFLEFFFPVMVGKDLGWSFSDISKGYLLNGMIIILAGLNVVRFVGRRFVIEKRLYLGVFIMISSILIMGILNSSLGMILSIVTLSVALSFMEGNFLEYYTSFGSTQNMGSMKSMSIYTLFDKGIMYFVPYIYALVLGGSIGTNLIIMVGLVCIYMIILTYILKKR